MHERRALSQVASPLFSFANVCNKRIRGAQPTTAKFFNLRPLQGVLKESRPSQILEAVDEKNRDMPADEGTGGEAGECSCTSSTSPASSMADTSKDYHLLQDQYPFAASTRNTS